jgi:hypothetical protein
MKKVICTIILPVILASCSKVETLEKQMDTMSNKTTSMSSTTAGMKETTEII